MGWVSPTGGSGTDWADIDKAYDGNNDTYAYESVPGLGNWSETLELTRAAINCSKVRFDIDNLALKFNSIDLDVYYDGGWHDVFEGAYEDHLWIEKELGDTYEVTKARLKCFLNWMDPEDLPVYEFEFWEVEATTSTSTTTSTSSTSTSTTTSSSTSTSTTSSSTSTTSTSTTSSSTSTSTSTTSSSTSTSTTSSSTSTSTTSSSTSTSTSTTSSSTSTSTTSSSTSTTSSSTSTSTSTTSSSTSTTSTSTTSSSTSTSTTSSSTSTSTTSSSTSTSTSTTTSSSTSTSTTSSSTSTTSSSTSTSTTSSSTSTSTTSSSTSTSTSTTSTSTTSSSTSTSTTSSSTSTSTTTSTSTSTTSTSTTSTSTTLPPCPRAICLYVDGFGVEKDQWTKVGISPYLDWGANDYVHEVTDNEETGDYTFEDTAQAGFPTNVDVELYVKRAAASETVTVFIHDGTQWHNAGTITPGAAYAWKTLDVSGILNTFAKINAAKVYLHYNA